MRRFIRLVLFLAVVGAAAGFWLTQPKTLTAAQLPKHTPDLKNGERMFNVGGCASCHAAPASDKCEDHASKDKTRLAGGKCFKTPFGTFVAPNISSDKETGIGAWSDLDFVNAMVKGVSPKGEHYYPAFPYTSYQRMRIEDILDLKAFLATLPEVRGRAKPHEVGFPFNIRRGLGMWKLLYLDGQPFTPDPKATPEVNAGAYLVNGPGHCGECHTPRNAIGGFERSRWLAGGKAPEGDGIVPNLTSHKTGIESYSAKDLVEILTSGLTPSGDVIGGSMASVVDNLAKIPEADRAAIAAYLKSLPPIELVKPATK